MKEFNLELAKAGHPVCTRDGNPVRIICFDVKGTNYPIVAAIMIGNEEYINQYPNGGEYYADGHESPGDLMMVSEVEEDEDEKIRKELIGHFAGFRDNISKEWYGIKVNDIIAWLEKQSKQTSTDKFEPKFKVGDWITNNEITFQIAKIDDYWYYSDNGDKVCSSYVHDFYHLWTIQDAKDGDVLVDGYNNIGLYNKEVKGNFWNSYIYLGWDNRLYDFGGYHDLKNTNKNTEPATKKQRDLLFQKIKEAGYEWDAEKKELKKIEQKLTWSDYDRDMLDNLIEDEFCPLDSEYISWFKSLKDRFQQQNK